MWKIEFDERAIKEANKLDRSARAQIARYLAERIAPSLDPRMYGKALHGNKSGLWRYRVRDYRIICNIEDEKNIIHVLGVGHRKNVYKK